MGRPRRTVTDESLTADEWDHLLTGWEFSPGLAFEDGEHRLRRWKAHRDELMRFCTRGPDWQEIEVPEAACWAREPAGPGYRPMAWWDYEAPGYRELIDPDGLRAQIRGWDLTDEEAEDRFLMTVRAVRSWSGPSWCGIPTLGKRDHYYVPLDREWPEDTYLPGDSRWYESEREFLERHDLLFEWEADAMKEEAD